MLDMQCIEYSCLRQWKRASAAITNDIVSTHILKEEETAKLEKVDLEGAQVHFNVNSFLYSATMFLLLNLFGQTLFEYLYHLTVLLHSPMCTGSVCRCHTKSHNWRRGCSTGGREYYAGRSCRGLSPWPLGNCVWFRLGLSWCYSCVPSVGLPRSCWSSQICCFWNWKWSILVSKSVLYRDRA